MKLIICEKQIAAKKIAEILSDGAFEIHKKNGVEFYSFKDKIVVGLSGHILKVDFPDEYSSWSKINLKDLINAKIVYLPDKKEIIKLLKDLSKDADELIIATDYDTEGESIGLEAINVINKDVPIKRMKFSEITKESIKKAYNNMIEFNLNLALSADARREIDLIWGAVLSRFLSLSVKRLGKSFLSAGRVQSPTLALIVKKELERLNFKPEKYFEVVAHFNGFDAKVKLKEKKEIKEKEGVVKEVIKTKQTVNPPLPLNTTSFLREAASIGFSSMNAMRIAESLYLKGVISYPRTDNQKYPNTINIKKIVNSLKEYKQYFKYLNKELKPTAGKETKDHPPIHPTGEKTELTNDEKKIYDLIVKRFLATLSNPCVQEKTKLKIKIGEHIFEANGIKFIEKGWRGIIPSKEKILPDIEEGDVLKIKKIECLEKETQPPNRYGHGTIIKIMSDLNLGTKSTRPTIIQKLINRSYILPLKSLTPTPLAISVINTLSKYATLITEPEMTRSLEEKMKCIEEGKVKKDEVVRESRDLLLKAYMLLEKNKKEIINEIIKGIQDSRKIGTCPKCNHELIIRNSKNGRFIGCTGYPSCKNTYPLPKTGKLFVSIEKCKECGFRKIVLIKRRVFIFCPNIDCPSKDNDEYALKLRALRQNNA